MGNPSVKKGLCVEFVGMSGVGKTAVAKELRRVLREEGCDFFSWLWMQENDFLSHNKIKRYVLPLLYAVKSVAPLKILGKLIVIFFKLNPFRLSASEREHYYDTIRVFLIRNFLMQRNRADIYLFDEAVLNSVFSRINVKKLSRVTEELLRVVLWNNCTTVFVFANAPADVAIDRLIYEWNPGHGSEESRERLKNHPEAREKYQAMLANYIENEKKIVNVLERRNISFIKIETIEPAADNAKRIFEFLRYNFLSRN